MSKKKKFILNKECFYQDIDNVLFLLHTKTGQYHEINGSGKYIIEILDSNSLSIDEIIDKINHSQYKLKRNDIANFIDQLFEREIISIEG